MASRPLYRGPYSMIVPVTTMKTVSAPTPGGRRHISQIEALEISENHGRGVRRRPFIELFSGGRSIVETLASFFDPEGL